MHGTAGVANPVSLLNEPGKQIRRAAMAFAGAAAMAACMTTHAQQPTPPSAEELFRPPIVLDAHEDILLNLMNPRNNRSLAEPGANGQANFENWKKGGINAVFFAVWIDPRNFRGEAAVQRADQTIALFNRQIQLYPDRLVACDTSDEVRRAVASGKIAALLGIEGGIAINNDLANIARFRSMGVRYMTLTWRGNLDWAGSSQDIRSPFRRGEELLIAENPSPGGLTELGRKIISEMNRVGMIVDLSHVSDETFFDAIKASTKPVMLSHSNARALSNHPRNVSDDMLRALKSNGGVIGINFWAELLEPNGRGSKKDGARPVSVESVLDQIDHVVKIAGIDHVGLGTDYEGMNDLPPDLKNASTMGKVFSGMRKRGYSEADIRKFAAENFLRIMKANE
jgi:membrane dipeptidase